MRKLTAILSAVVICATAFSFDETADFKKFMTGFLPKLQKAFEKMDVKFFEDFTTDDFTETMMGRTMKKKESMDSMRAQVATTKSMSAKFKLLSASAKNGVGTSTSQGWFVMVSKPTPQDKKTHKLEMEMVEKETWVKVGKTWKLKKLEQVGQMKMKMDGKPMDPNAMGGG